jgi:hypothetical protein
MASEDTIRDTLNTGDPNRIAAALRAIGFGDILNRLLALEAALATITTANGSDATTTQTLANAIKTAFNAAVTAGGFSETLTVSTNAATLTNQPGPSGLIQVNAVAGTTTGVKKVRRGAVSGTNALVPLTGEVIWDGGKKLLFSATDAVTSAQVTYAQTGDTTVSCLRPKLGAAADAS